MARRGRVPELEPAYGYRLWAVSYADETNELQRLEAELRHGLMPEVRGAVALDVGAGTGRVSGDLRAAGAAVVAVDLVAEMLLRSPEWDAMRGRACVADVLRLPFAEASFDLAVCALTLAHVADLRGALGDMVRLLRPGGALLVTDFHPDATRRGWQRSFSHEGKTCAIRQHAHSLQAYEQNLQELGCPMERFGERRWKGQPVVFGLRARVVSPGR